jgi:hypothetical protein
MFNLSKDLIVKNNEQIHFDFFKKLYQKTDSKIGPHPKSFSDPKNLPHEARES